MKRPDRAELRAAVWTLVALGRLRRELARNGLADVTISPPRRAGADGTRGVTGVLRRRKATCLERSLLLQRWYAAQGIERDVIIGVTAPSDGFAAHAWLDGEPAHAEQAFEELHRLAP